MSESKSSQETRADSIVRFPLVGATDIELGTALGLAHWDFLMWHSQAVSIARFPDEAKLVGVDSVLRSRVVEAFDLAESQNIVDWSQAEPGVSKSAIVNTLVDQQFRSIHRAARVAAIVMLHSAIERSIWRHIRFGMVAERDKAVELIGDRKLSVKEIAVKTPNDLINHQLERYWWQVERDSICKKWDTLVDLIGKPRKLNDDIWQFDRPDLSTFDEVRRDCVHYDGSSAVEFDLEGFSNQAQRAQWVWIVHVASSLDVKIPQETLVGKAPASPS